MKIKTLLCSLAVGLLLTGCKTPQLGYFQDLKNGDKKELTSENIIKLQPGDRLSILDQTVFLPLGNILSSQIPAIFSIAGWISCHRPQPSS